MALTWYLSVPIIGLLVFDLTGNVSKVNALTGIIIGAGFFAAMVLSSQWWFGHFLCGPVEWVWRTVSDGSRQFRRFMDRLTPTRGASPANPHRV